MKNLIHKFRQYWKKEDVKPELPTEGTAADDLERQLDTAYIEYQDSIGDPNGLHELEKEMAQMQLEYMKLTGNPYNYKRGGPLE